MDVQSPHYATDEGEKQNPGHGMVLQSHTTSASAVGYPQIGYDFSQYGRQHPGLSLQTQHQYDPLNQPVASPSEISPHNNREDAPIQYNHRTLGWQMSPFQGLPHQPVHDFGQRPEGYITNSYGLYHPFTPRHGHPNSNGEIYDPYNHNQGINNPSYSSFDSNRTADSGYITGPRESNASTNPQASFSTAQRASQHQITADQDSQVQFSVEAQVASPTEGQTSCEQRIAPKQPKSPKEEESVPAAKKPSKRGSGRKRKRENLTPESELSEREIKRRANLARNRDAAAKCRDKKRERDTRTKHEAGYLKEQNDQLKGECEALIGELRGLREILCVVAPEKLEKFGCNVLMALLGNQKWWQQLCSNSCDTAKINAIKQKLMGKERMLFGLEADAHFIEGVDDSKIEGIED